MLARSDWLHVGLKNECFHNMPLEALMGRACLMFFSAYFFCVFRQQLVMVFIVCFRTLMLNGWKKIGVMRHYWTILQCLKTMSESGRELIVLGICFFLYGLQRIQELNAKHCVSVATELF